MLTYVHGDELGFWEQPIGGSLAEEDFSSGWSFRLTLTPIGSTTPAVTMTNNIVGSTGMVTVQWPATGGLNDLQPGRYVARLRCRRASDDRDFTVSEMILIEPEHVPV